MSRLRISLITVSYNSVATIRDTLASVAGQTVRPFEHIVVDGGSSDGTTDVLATWTGHRIAWSSGRDRGIYDAMNKGLKRSTGDVVGFLNADDVYFDPHALSSITASFHDPRTDAVFGNLVYSPLDGSSRVVRYWDSSRFSAAGFAAGLMPPHPTFYVRRDLVERLGGFRLDLAMANDFEFCARYLARHRIHARHIPRILVRMRLGGESNRSWRNVLRQNRCIFTALRGNGLPISFLFPLAKALDKGRQFLLRPPGKSPA